MQSNEIRLITRLGSGGYGEVHKAMVAGLHGPVAVKTLIKENEESVTRFEREVKILAKLDHAHVMPIHKYQLDQSPYRFAMPLADSSLFDELPYLVGDTHRIQEYFRQILTGMSYAHSKGVIHRDLKPQNILLIAGTIYVADFGLGKRIEGSHLHDSFTRSRMEGGTIPYAAPEQLTDFRNARKPADIYSLGKLLYQMLTNLLPYPEIHIEKVPDRFRYLVLKSTDTDPARRYSSVDEMLRSFNDAANPKNFEQVNYSETGPALMDTDTFEIARANSLSQHLVKHLENADIMRRDFPKIPKTYLSHFLNDDLAKFKSILGAYDGHVSGQLEFTYCDTVSDTYLRILSLTDDLEIYMMALLRLMLMGASHNRFKVMDDFRRLIIQIGAQEPSKALVAADIIKGNPEPFAVIDYRNSAKLDNAPLPLIVRESIDEVRGNIQSHL